MWLNDIVLDKGSYFSDGVNIKGWLSNNKRGIYYSDDEYVILLKNKILEIRCNFFGRIKTLKI